ncbi:hypothetical protein HYV71_03885 [Candidatus Uhrbacteria bacterium]|nr:hypothetical protein [Candidatus Uhrbacteria bacterium]
MDSTYVCPECGQEYDEPGVCDSCQVDLIEDGGDKDLEFDGTDELQEDQGTGDSFDAGNDEEDFS